MHSSWFFALFVSFFLFLDDQKQNNDIFVLSIYIYIFYSSYMYRYILICVCVVVKKSSFQFSVLLRVVSERALWLFRVFFRRYILRYFINVWCIEITLHRMGYIYTCKLPFYFMRSQLQHYAVSILAGWGYRQAYEVRSLIPPVKVATSAESYHHHAPSMCQS